MAHLGMDFFKVILKFSLNVSHEKILESTKSHSIILVGS